MNVEKYGLLCPFFKAGPLGNIVFPANKADFRFFSIKILSDRFLVWNRPDLPPGKRVQFPKPPIM